MCGRFSLSEIGQVLLDRFNVTGDYLKPRYNIAPTQLAPVILNRSSDKLTMAKWGLIPHWAKDDKMAYSTINARVESITEKPSYKGPFHNNRCLVPADGFYEWKTIAGKKIPYYFKVNGLFAFAGIYDTWEDPEGNSIKTFSIITVRPNPTVKKVHNRMPAILKKEHEQLWLKERPQEKLLEMLMPYQGHMEYYQVDTRVNYVGNEGPELIERVARKQSSLADF